MTPDCRKATDVATLVRAGVLMAPARFARLGNSHVHARDGRCLNGAPV